MLHWDDMLGKTKYVNRAFVQLAVEAGIVPVIQSLVGLALDADDLLFQLKRALEADNLELAKALTPDTLRKLLEYAGIIGQVPPVLLPLQLPPAADQDGPASVFAGRDGGTPTQINITFSGQPANYLYEIYLDGLFQKRNNLAPSGGFTNDILSGVVDDNLQHTIRVLYVTPAGALTRFGSIALFL